MTSSDPRIVVLPRRIASEVITSAVVRGGRGVAVVQLVLILPVLFDVFGAHGIPAAAVLPALVALVMAAFVTVSLFVPKRWFCMLTCAVLVAGALLWVVLLATALPSVASDQVYLFNRVPLVLIFAGPPSRRPGPALAWSAGGLAASLGVVALGDAIAGVPFQPGGGAAASWAVYASALLVVGAVRFWSESSAGDIERLERETRRRALEAQFEQRAAAMIHDTVLGDLTAVMNSRSELDERARERFRADVALLKSPTWLDSAVLDVDVDDANLRNGSVALASEMQWRGLTVDVTGINDAVVRLAPDARIALHAALRECLENVLRHSGETTAELVVGGDESVLTYMVIDRGVGFDPDAVGEEHLGIRRSVIARVAEHGGTVRIWSRHGSGTSVLVSMPIVAEASA